jgi:peptidoglycan-associated lipoprotein
VKPIVPAFPVGLGPERVPALARVYFAFDKWDLSDEMRKILDGDAAWLIAHPDVTVRVEGHCDERGTAEYNLALGEWRAVAVRRYLVAQGVAAPQLMTVSYGAEKPVVEGHDEAAWSKNRRVEFTLVDRPQVTEQKTSPPAGKM